MLLKIGQKSSTSELSQICPHLRFCFIKRDHRRTFLEWFRWENQFLTAAVCLKAAKVLAKCQGIHLTWNCLLLRNTLYFKILFFVIHEVGFLFYQDFHKSKISIKNERIFLGSLNQPPFSNFQHFIYTFPVQFPSGFFHILLVSEGSASNFWSGALQYTLLANKLKKLNSNLKHFST